MKKHMSVSSKASKTSSPGGTFEYYHLYNRGIDNKTIFNTQGDFERFKAYLYLLNDQESPRAANFFVGERAASIYDSARGEQLVAIGAYALMQNYFHLLVHPVVENGVSRFMQKLLTAYTMYYNDRTYRKGSLFQGAYKRTSVINDAHLKCLFGYIHFTPADFFQKNWQLASEEELKFLERKIATYPYSSANEYVSGQHVITSPTQFPRYIARAKNIDHHREFLLDHRARINKDLRVEGD